MCSTLLQQRSRKEFLIKKNKTIISKNKNLLVEPGEQCIADITSLSLSLSRFDSFSFTPFPAIFK